MAATDRLVDSSFLVSLLDRRDRHHAWAAAEGARLAPPWRTCEAVLSELFFLLGQQGSPALIALLDRGALSVAFEFGREKETVLRLMRKYSNVPMSLADACLVRMSETHADPVVLTADDDFRIYRRHGRRVIPCAMPT